MRIPTAAFTGVLLIAVSACSSPTAGEPKGAEPAPSETVTGTSSSAPVDSGSDGEPDFANTALCDLLTGAEAAGLGGSATGEPGNSTEDGAPLCAWKDATSLVVGFQANGQAGRAPSGPEITNTPIEVAGKAAVLSKRVTSVRTNCQVLVDVGKTATVATLAGVLTKGEGSYDECDLATRMANIVIPKVLQKY
jgi:hypothetical protein